MTASSPFQRLGCHQVLEQADWIGVALIMYAEPCKAADGRGIHLRIRVERSLRGQAPEGILRYWETAPHPGLQPPVWTGSGLESQVCAGETVLCLTHGCDILRIEPLDSEKKILAGLSRGAQG